MICQKFVIFISHKRSRVQTRYFTKLCIIISCTCIIFLVNLNKFFAVICVSFHERCGFHQIRSHSFAHYVREKNHFHLLYASLGLLMHSSSLIRTMSKIYSHQKEMNLEGNWAFHISIGNKSLWKFHKQNDYLIGILFFMKILFFC